MTDSSGFPLVAVDVGNSRIKLGAFDAAQADALPCPDPAVSLPLDCSDEQLANWLPRPASQYAWAISTVNRPAAARVVESLGRLGATRSRLLARRDLPLEVDLPQPERVGLDRLCNALAAGALGKGRSALVVAVGTAIVVDLVSSEGAFLGGSILPSLDMGARALHEFTDLLPLVEVLPPQARIGRSTVEAIQFGLHWGAIGAIRELSRRLSDDDRAPIYLTGGGAAALAADLASAEARQVEYVPHLTLAGIALAMRDSPAKPSS